MLKNLSDFLRPFSPSTLLFSINNSTKFLNQTICIRIMSVYIRFVSFQLLSACLDVL